MENKPLKIRLREKEKLQLDSDLYLYGEGKGMCQSGAIEIFQLGFGGDEGSIRFHKKDIPKIVKALTGKIPLMTEKNDEEFNKSLQELKRI